MPLPPQVPEIGALDLLLSVARLGSLGRAAREHGISQPAASSRIRHLEGLLRIPLIERSTLGSCLTAHGAMVADWAQVVVSAAAALNAGVCAMRSGQGRRIRIACSMTIAEYVLPSRLVELRRRRPDSVIGMRVVNSATVTELLLGGEVDIGFIEGPDLPDGLEGRPVGHDELVLVVAPDHPWARRRRAVTAQELGTTALVCREPGSGTRYTLDSKLAGIADRAGPSVEFSSTTAIKAAVEAGLGPSVLSSLAVAADLTTHRLVAVPVDGVDLSRTLRAVWRAGAQLTEVQRDVVATTCQPAEHPARVRPPSTTTIVVPEGVNRTRPSSVRPPGPDPQSRPGDP